MKRCNRRTVKHEELSLNSVLLFCWHFVISSCLYRQAEVWQLPGNRMRLDGQLTAQLTLINSWLRLVPHTILALNGEWNPFFKASWWKWLKEFSPVIIQHWTDVWKSLLSALTRLMTNQWLMWITHQRRHSGSTVFVICIGFFFLWLNNPKTVSKTEDKGLKSLVEKYTRSLKL